MCIDNTTPKAVGSNPTPAIIQLKYAQQLNGEQYGKYY